MEVESEEIASSLERDYRQFRGNFLSPGHGQVAPLESKSDRRHDRFHFIPKCFPHIIRQCLLKL